MADSRSQNNAASSSNSNAANTTANTVSIKTREALANPIMTDDALQLAIQMLTDKIAIAEQGYLEHKRKLIGLGGDNIKKRYQADLEAFSHTLKIISAQLFKDLDISHAVPNGQEADWLRYIDASRNLSDLIIKEVLSYPEEDRQMLVINRWASVVDQLFDANITNLYSHKFSLHSSDEIKAKIDIKKTDFYTACYIVFALTSLDTITKLPSKLPKSVQQKLTDIGLYFSKQDKLCDDQVKLLDAGIDIIPAMSALSRKNELHKAQTATAHENQKTTMKLSADLQKSKGAKLLARYKKISDHYSELSKKISADLVKHSENENAVNLNDTIKTLNEDFVTLGKEITCGDHDGLQIIRKKLSKYLNLDIAISTSKNAKANLQKVVSQYNEIVRLYDLFFDMLENDLNDPDIKDPAAHYADVAKDYEKQKTDIKKEKRHTSRKYSSAQDKLDLEDNERVQTVFSIMQKKTDPNIEHRFNIKWARKLRLPLVKNLNQARLELYGYEKEHLERKTDADKGKAAIAGQLFHMLSKGEISASQKIEEIDKILRTLKSISDFEKTQTDKSKRKQTGKEKVIVEVSDNLQEIVGSIKKILNSIIPFEKTIEESEATIAKNEKKQQHAVMAPAEKQQLIEKPVENGAENKRDVTKKPTLKRIKSQKHAKSNSNSINEKSSASSSASAVRQDETDILTPGRRKTQKEKFRRARIHNDGLVTTPRQAESAAVVQTAPDVFFTVDLPVTTTDSVTEIAKNEKRKSGGSGSSDVPTLDFGRISPVNETPIATTHVVEQQRAVTERAPEKDDSLTRVRSFTLPHTDSKTVVAQERSASPPFSVSTTNIPELEATDDAVKAILNATGSRPQFFTRERSNTASGSTPRENSAILHHDEPKPASATRTSRERGDSISLTHTTSTLFLKTLTRSGRSPRVVAPVQHTSSAPLQKSPRVVAPVQHTSSAPLQKSPRPKGDSIVEQPKSASFK